MIILLARKKGAKPQKPGPGWALLGGNHPLVLGEILGFIARNSFLAKSNDPRVAEVGKNLLQNWRSHLEKVTKEAFPHEEWDASMVNFYIIPDNAVRMKVVRSYDLMETAVYWLEGDTTFQYKVAEELDVISIL